MHGSHDDDWLKGTPARTVTQALANPNSTCYYVSRSGAPKVGLLMALHLTTAHSYRLPSKLLEKPFPAICRIIYSVYRRTLKCIFNSTASICTLK